jgi:hypothetical protein
MNHNIITRSNTTWIPPGDDVWPSWQNGTGKMYTNVQKMYREHRMGGFHFRVSTESGQFLQRIHSVAHPNLAYHKENINATRYCDQTVHILKWQTVNSQCLRLPWYLQFLSRWIQDGVSLHTGRVFLIFTEALDRSSAKFEIHYCHNTPHHVARARARGKINPSTRGKTGFNMSNYPKAVCGQSSSMEQSKYNYVLISPGPVHQPVDPKRLSQHGPGCGSE